MEAKTKRISVVGCIIDETHLDEIDSLLLKAAVDAKPGDVNISRYEVHYREGNALIRPASIVELQRLLGKDLRKWNTISILHSNSAIAFRIVLFRKGIIEIDGFGPSPQYDFAISTVESILKAAQEDYNWLIRQIVLKRTARNLAVSILSLTSLFLVPVLIYYIYAKIVGIDIDPSLIPANSEATRTIVYALKSSDPNQKLDALLRFNLKDFTNVSDLLATLKVMLVCLSVSAALSGLFVGVRRVLDRLHPKIFVNIGHHQRILTRMHEKRQIWFVAILIGFAINVAAGFLVAVLV